MKPYPDDREIWSNGARLTYRRAGTGDAPPVCFIPGWCCDRSVWDAQVAQFARNYPVVAIDFPGFGDSPLPDEMLRANGSTLMSRLAEVVAALLTAERLSGCRLVGHSIGAALALAVAAKHPGSVSRVVAVDGLTNLHFYPRQEAAMIEAIVTPLEGDFPNAVRDVAEGWFLPDADPAQKQRIIAGLSAGGQAPAVAILRDFLGWDMMACLNAFPGPVDAIVAEAFHDGPSVGAVLGDRVTVQTMGGVGHFLMIERPTPFNDVLEAILLRPPAR